MASTRNANVSLFLQIFRSGQVHEQIESIAAGFASDYARRCRGRSSSARLYH